MVVCDCLAIFRGSVIGRAVLAGESRLDAKAKWQLLLHFAGKTNPEITVSVLEVIRDAERLSAHIGTGLTRIYCAVSLSNCMIVMQPCANCRQNLGRFANGWSDGIKILI